MNFGTTVREQIFAQIRSLFTALGLLDSKGDLAWNATFLCMEAPQLTQEGW